MTDHAQARDDMNAMYRWTRHIYDASRKYFLLGRDVLIDKLNAQNDEHVCEVGCGTARNLLKMADHYPETWFYGLDVSDVMLETARKNLDAGGHERVPLAQGYAERFDPKSCFDLQKPFDKIVFSYALSIIPPWKASLDHALDILPAGGEIHIVDFGGQDGLPKFFRAFLFWWLKLFHVYHKPEILKYLEQVQNNGKGTLKTENLYHGYAYYAVFSKA